MAARIPGITPAITFGVVSEKGERAYMEDVYFTSEDICKECGVPSRLPPQQYFGVYDGHGGVITATYLEKELHQSIIKHAEFERDPITAIRDGFIQCDQQLHEQAIEEDLEETSGSTAVSVLIRGDTVYYGHVGDCRAVLSMRGECVELTNDHTPSVPLEKTRILSSGHVVSEDDRVDGLLAVSRAFGDFEFKKRRGSRPHANAITSNPDVASHSLDGVDFIIMACDGLWDVMTSAEAVSFAVEGYQKGLTTQEVSRSLYNHAFRRRTCDNVTIIVVRFGDGPIATPALSDGTVTSWSAHQAAKRNAAAAAAALDQGPPGGM